MSLEPLEKKQKPSTVAAKVDRYEQLRELIYTVLYEDTVLPPELIQMIIGYERACCRPYSAAASEGQTFSDLPPSAHVFLREVARNAGVERLQLDFFSPQKDLVLSCVYRVCYYRHRKLRVWRDYHGASLRRIFGDRDLLVYTNDEAYAYGSGEAYYKETFQSGMDGYHDTTMPPDLRSAIRNHVEDDGHPEQTRLLVQSDLPESKFGPLSYVLVDYGDETRPLTSNASILRINPPPISDVERMWLYDDGRRIIASTSSFDLKTQTLVSGRIKPYTDQTRGSTPVEWDPLTLTTFTCPFPPYEFPSTDGRSMLVGCGHRYSNRQIHFIKVDLCDDVSPLRVTPIKLPSPSLVKFDSFRDGVIEYRPWIDPDQSEGQREEGLYDTVAQEVVCTRRIEKNEIETSQFGIGCRLLDPDKDGKTGIVVFEKYRKLY